MIYLIETRGLYKPLHRESGSYRYADIKEKIMQLIKDEFSYKTGDLFETFKRNKQTNNYSQR